MTGFCILLPISSSPASASIDAELRRGMAEYESLLEEKKWSAAVDVAARLLDMAEFELREDDERVAKLALNYADLLIALKYSSEATDALERARSHFQHIYGVKSPDFIPLLVSEGDFLADTRVPAGQKKKYAEALNISAQAFGRDSIEYADLALDLGTRILDRSGSSYGLRYVKGALKSYEKQLGEDDFRSGRARLALARFDLWDGRHKRAEDHLLAALETFDDSTPTGRKWNLSARRYLVRNYIATGDDEQANEQALQVAKMLANGEDTVPVLLFRAAARYPALMLEARLTGFVEFSYEVDESGYVRAPVVIREVGGAFKREATSALMQYRYAPAIENGQPVAAKDISTVIEFQIEGFPNPPRF